MSDSARRSRITLIALGAAVVLVVVIALIAVFARGDVEPLDPATPQGVVQRYSQAVIDGDVPTALTFLVPEVADTCQRVTRGGERLRITLLESTERDASARVRVLIVTTYGEQPFGADEYESEEAFDLVKVDGDWLVETAPWQLAVCAANGSP